MIKFEEAQQLKYPLVSVIIPCYNAEKTIERTLSCLEEQTYEHFEVIIIDDGSSDNSDLLIKKKLDSCKFKYEYIRQNNTGVSGARNVGIKKAKGKYITFLDADDLYHKDFLIVLLNSIEQNNVDTSFCSYTRKLNNFKKTIDKSRSKELSLIKHEELMKQFMYRIGPNGFTTFMYKSSIIKNNNIFFTTGLKYGEDLEFTWKYLSHCETGVFFNEPLYLYFDTPESATNQIDWSITESLKSVKNIEKYLQANNDSFYHIYKNYMYDRTLMAILLGFSKVGRRNFYDKLIQQNNIYQIKNNMIDHCKDYRIIILSLMLSFNKNLFYWSLNNLYKLVKF